MSQPVILFSGSNYSCVSMSLAYIAFALIVWASFLLSEAAYWKRQTLKGQTSKTSFTTTTNINSTHASTTKPLNDCRASISTPNHQRITSFKSPFVLVNVYLQFFAVSVSSAANVGTLVISILNYSKPINPTQFNEDVVMLAPLYIIVVIIARCSFNRPDKNHDQHRLSLTFLVFSVIMTSLAIFSIYASVNNLNLQSQIPRSAELQAYDVTIVCSAVVHLLTSIWGAVMAVRMLRRGALCTTGSNSAVDGSLDPDQPKPFTISRSEVHLPSIGANP